VAGENELEMMPDVPGIWALSSHIWRGFHAVCCAMWLGTGAYNAVMSSWLLELNSDVVACRRCPRLVEHCQRIAQEKRRAYRDQQYWGKPVPGFGDPEGRVLILGLAPGAHGSNRTGRPFTGDGSGYFMYPVLHRAGFASQPNATHINDGLKLRDLYITAAVRCAPPQNKPTPEEIRNCSAFLDREIAGLKNIKVVVALGKIGFDAYLDYLKRRGKLQSKAPYVFAHGAHYKMPDGRILLASYHPSLQNTNTGKLTEKMFLEIFREARRLCDSSVVQPKKHSTTEDAELHRGRSARVSAKPQRRRAKAGSS
jgi:uracil-DNA glycosylase family 4